MLGAALGLLTVMAHAAEKPTEIRFGTPIAGINGNKFGYGNNFSSAQIKGLFEKEFEKDNIKVTWYSYKNAGPGINEALANNQLDFTLLGDLPALIGRSRNVDTRLILSSGRNNVYLVVPAQSEAKTVDDLKGKKVGLFKGTIVHLQVTNILSSLGLDERDFKEINTDSALGSVQLTSGQIDGLWTTSSAAYTLVNKGIGKIIYSTRNKPEQQGQVFTLVREEFARQYPDIVQRVVNILVEESHWASESENKDNLFNLWSKSGYDAKSFAFDYEGEDLKLEQSPLINKSGFNTLDKNIELAKNLNLIKKNPNVDQWVDFSYLNNALKNLNYQNYW